MISLVFWILAAICNAVMDTVTHHWEQSVFKKFAKNNMYGWWGDAEFTWVRKYEGLPIDVFTQQKPLKRRKLFWKINFPVQLTDAWHFFKTLMVCFESAALGTAIIWPPEFLNIFNFSGVVKFAAYFIISGILWNLSFSIFYNKILCSKK